MAITGKAEARQRLNRSGQFNTAQKDDIADAIDKLEATSGGGTTITLNPQEPVTIADGGTINLTLTGNATDGYVIGIQATGP